MGIFFCEVIKTKWICTIITLIPNDLSFNGLLTNGFIFFFRWSQIHIGSSQISGCLDIQFCTELFGITPFVHHMIPNKKFTERILDAEQRLNCFWHFMMHSAHTPTQSIWPFINFSGVRYVKYAKLCHGISINALLKRKPKRKPNTAQNLFAKFHKQSEYLRIFGVRFSLIRSDGQLTFVLQLCKNPSTILN